MAWIKMLGGMNQSCTEWLKTCYMPHSLNTRAMILVSKVNGTFFDSQTIYALINSSHSVTSITRVHFPLNSKLYCKLWILWSFLPQILKATMYLHSGNVIHRDQKVFDMIHNICLLHQCIYSYEFIFRNFFPDYSFYLIPKNLS